MPMLVNPHRSRPVAAAPADHPLVIQIRNLPPVPNIQSIFDVFHAVLGAQGYRLGIKYLYGGIHVPRAGLTPRNVTKDPIHVLFPKYRPAKHPTDDKYPYPPISPSDARSCLPAMQAAQRKFGLFPHEARDWRERGWPTKIDPENLSWHSSNAYVTPLHSDFYYLSIDDVDSAEKRQFLAELGIRPALIITSSVDPDTGADNDQWTIKIPKLPQYRQELEHFNFKIVHIHKT